MVQPAGMPRFNEDSAFKKHWPLLWITTFVILIAACFVADFNNLNHSFDNRLSSDVNVRTSFIFKTNRDRIQYNRPASLGQKGQNNLAERSALWFDAANKFANRITSDGYFQNPESKGAGESRDYLKWFFHRRLGLYFIRHEDYGAAQSEFEAAGSYAEALGPAYPCKALSLSDSAMLLELRAVEMQQVAQMLLGAALPIFSFLAAVLPFALFLSFIKSRDKLESSREESETASARLFLKTFLLASWFGVIVTGWVALRNYGMGLASGWSDPTALAFFGSLAALLLSSSLMLRYMPPYKSISLKRTLVGFGFNGGLLILKAVAIYFGLCFSLAGHPALKDVLFCESLYTNRAAQAREVAAQALDCARKTMRSEPIMQEELAADMSQILFKATSADPGKNRAAQIRDRLREIASEDLVIADNDKVPYLWQTSIDTGSVYQSAPVSVNQLTMGMTVKACLAYLLLFYPECVAYLLLGLRRNKWALKVFSKAVQMKEYFLGVDHWLVVSMMEMFAACILAFHKFDSLRDVGEEYLREAIKRYERSRGRHDQLTISAKMSLAHFYSERGDDKQAERILQEALRDIGKDFDILAYCALLSELGRLFSRRANYSRAKQMYKQVIDLLELKLSKCSPCQGLLGYVRNIYATTPTVQLEVKLVCAYLDLASVFQKAKYNGEAQRLTEDASKRISAFEKDFIVGTEVAVTYYKARLALAKILSDQGRCDECFKLLATTKKQLLKWGYFRLTMFFQFVVSQCEIELAASRGLPKYIDLARKDYFDGCKAFGHFGGAGEVRERWLKLGEKFGNAKSLAAFNKASCLALPASASPGNGTAAGNTTVAGNTTAAGSVTADDNATADGNLSSWFLGAPSAELPPPSFFDQVDAPAGQPRVKFGEKARDGALLQSSDKSQTDARIKSGQKVQGPASTARASRVIQESRETADEGIVIRWQRERKNDELMYELRPEGG